MRLARSASKAFAASATTSAPTSTGKTPKRLKNDRPRLRKKIWHAWQVTHARTEARARELTLHCPAHLLEE